MQAYVISLVRSPDRPAHIIGQLDVVRAHYKMATGIDGKDVDLAAAPLPSSRLLAQVVDESQTGSAGGYLITREACARMVKTILPVRAVGGDWAFFYQQDAINHLRCVVPRPVIQSPAFRTITSSYHRPGSLYANVREAIAGSKVPIAHQALALRRQERTQRYAIGRTELVEDPPGVLQECVKMGIHVPTRPLTTRGK
jgi:hypothetical protein